MSPALAVPGGPRPGVGALRGCGGKGQEAQGHSVDAVPAAGLFRTVKLLALSGGFQACFSHLHKHRLHPGHSCSFRSCSGKMLHCGSKAQSEFKHQALPLPVVISTFRKWSLGCATCSARLGFGGGAPALPRCTLAVLESPSPGLNDDLALLWEQRQVPVFSCGDGAVLVPRSPWV